MNLTIDVHDYLSGDEIQKICREAIYDSIAQKFARETDVDRLITNLSYQFVIDAVSSAIGEDAKERITNEVARLIQREDSLNYVLWKRKDPWGGTDSKAVGIMNLAVEANRSLIFDLVKKQIQEYDFHDIDQVMYEAGKEVLREQIFGEE